MTKSISNTYLFISLMLPSVIFAGVESGKQAPNFSLTNEEGKSVELANYRGKTVVLEWYQSRPLYTPDTFAWLIMYNISCSGDHRGKKSIYS